jgi:hypothetical protein
MTLPALARAFHMEARGEPISGPLSGPFLHKLEGV